MKNVRYLTQGAVIAAAYFALALLQELLLPGSGSFVLQLRLAEALCVLALFTPAAIYGLSLGCLLYNLSSAGALPLDFLIGAVATFLAAGAMYALRKLRLWKLPLPALLMPAAFNGLFVGWELTVYYGGSAGFWLNSLWVSLGELAVLFTLGLALYLSLNRPGLREKLFGPPRP